MDKPFIFKMTPWEGGTYIAVLGALLEELPCRVIFCGFGALTNTKALMNKRKMQNLPKKTLNGNSYRATPKMALNVPKVSLSITYFISSFFLEKEKY